MLLFTAPLDFERSVYDELISLFPLPNGPEDVRIWLCNPKADFVIDDEVLKGYPALQIIATPSTGTNHIDLAACKKRNIKVLSLLNDRKGLNKITASSEFTLLMLLMSFRSVSKEVSGKNIGLVGYGRIGQNLHRYLGALQANVVFYDPARVDSTGLKELFFHSDVVIICCELNDTSRGMVDFGLLSSMRNGAILVNTARAEVISEVDLIEFLHAREDITYATDVLHNEVTGKSETSKELLMQTKADVLVTPHVAGETFESRTKAARIILELLKNEMRVAPNGR